MDPIYTAWGISAVLLYILLAIVYAVIFKITTKEFHKFTKKRVIADIIIYSFNIILLLFSVIYYKLDITPFTQSGMRIAFFSTFTILALVIDFFSVHLFVCSLVNIYKHLRKKRFKKNNKDLAIAIMYLIFLNGLSKKIMLALITVFVLLVISKTCPQDPCGVKIVQVFPDSPAEMAGITKGEVIVSTAYGQQIKTNTDFRELIETKKPGDSLRFETETGKKYDINLGEKDGKAYIGLATTQKLCPRTSCTMTAEVIDYTSGEPVVVETKIYDFE